MKAPMFSPKGFLTRAAILTFLFAIVHLVGLREFTSVLSGTSATGGSAKTLSATAGSVYIVLYFAFVLIVPILVLSSGIFAVLQLFFVPRIFQNHPAHKHPSRDGTR